MDIVENRGFANEDIENLEDKGPCAEPATATIREDVDGSMYLRILILQTNESRDKSCIVTLFDQLE